MGIFLQLFLTSEHLEDRALGLLALLLLQLADIDVLPQVDRSQAKRYQGNTNNDHQAHDMLVGSNNSIALGSAISKLQSDGDTAENESGVDFAGFGETLVELLRKHVVPHGAGDGESDGRAEAAEKSP